MTDERKAQLKDAIIQRIQTCMLGLQTTVDHPDHADDSQRRAAQVIKHLKLIAQEVRELAGDSPAQDSEA
jgi:hypothetical protein